MSWSDRDFATGLKYVPAPIGPRCPEEEARVLRYSISERRRVIASLQRGMRRHPHLARAIASEQERLDSELARLAALEVTP